MSACALIQRNTVHVQIMSTNLIPPFFLCTGELTEFLFSVKPFPSVGVFGFIGENIGGLKKELHTIRNRHSFDVHLEQTNLAEYRLILANSAYGSLRPHRLSIRQYSARFRRIIVKYSYSHSSTGTSLQSRLMQGNIIKYICIWKDFPAWASIAS